MLGARRAGMMTVLKCPSGEARPHWTVDHVVRRIVDLKEVLPALRTQKRPAVAAEAELQGALLR
jgi:hypothetical protein